REHIFWLSVHIYCGAVRAISERSCILRLVRVVASHESHGSWIDSQTDLAFAWTLDNVVCRGINKYDVIAGKYSPQGACFNILAWSIRNLQCAFSLSKTIANVSIPRGIHCLDDHRVQRFSSG